MNNKEKTSSGLSDIFAVINTDLSASWQPPEAQPPLFVLTNWSEGKACRSECDCEYKSCSITAAFACSLFRLTSCMDVCRFYQRDRVASIRMRDHWEWRRAPWDMRQHCFESKTAIAAEDVSCWRHESRPCESNIPHLSVPTKNRSDLQVRRAKERLNLTDCSIVTS